MNIRATNTLLELVPRALFKALADPSRLRLFANIACCPEPCTIGAASRCCPVDPSVASRHLALLRDAGLVIYARKGKDVLVRANVTALVTLLRDIAGALENCGQGAVGPEIRSRTTRVSYGKKPQRKRRKNDNSKSRKDP